MKYSAGFRGCSIYGNDVLTLVSSSSATCPEVNEPMKTDNLTPFKVLMGIQYLQEAITRCDWLWHRPVGNYCEIAPRRVLATALPPPPDHFGESIITVTQFCIMRAAFVTDR